MMEDVPVFVVVGNVNQGKSSIVAALAEDPTVPIAAHPGTTQRSGEYIFKSGDRPLFKLVDTPGFQEARAVLSWMQARSRSAADHRDIVKAFVETEGKADRFQDELRLLKPILEGAAVLYVVDASSRFQPSHEAEMEILRWTGQSGMALINRTRERDHSEEWRPILEQFFNVVRTFNAHTAGFQDRMNLLKSFRELREDWRGTMDRAIEIMEREWRSRRERSCRIISELLSQSLSHVEKERIAQEGSTDAAEERLSVAYRQSLRDLEAASRSEIEAIYQHRRLARDGEGVPLHQEDLFSERGTLAFGLKPTQLMKYGAAWGAAVGGTIDLFVGGLTFFVGAAIGAVAGGAGAYFGSDRIARSSHGKGKLGRLLLPGKSGEFQCLGPVISPRFAWVLCDRALVHYRAVRGRSHARQDVFEPADGSTTSVGVVATLPGTLRDALDQVFQAVIKQALKGEVSRKTTERMTQVLTEVLKEI